MGLPHTVPAAAHILLRLGLRAGEVAGLRLEDIDWRAEEVQIRGEGQRLDRLPLPVDVDDAVAGYLRRGRPATAGRQVFMTRSGSGRCGCC